MSQPTQSQSDTRPLVEIRDLDFAYCDRLVLKHINLDVKRGTTLGLIGPNGGGKTTLIRLLVGLLSPTRGTMTIDGMPVREAAARGDLIGYLPQRIEAQHDMPLSARQLVALSGRGGGGGSGGGSLQEELLAYVGLADVANRPIGALSGGQFQRLLIARALACAPRLLVLDEPTTGIDAESRRGFISLLRRLKQQLNLTIIMSSHDLQSLHELSDDVACLNLTMHLQHTPLRPPAAGDAQCGLQEAGEC